MKLVLITEWTPTQDNFKGPSALLFYLLQARDKNVQLVIYSTNKNCVSDALCNKIENDLNCKMIFIPKKIFDRIKTSRKINYYLSKFRRCPLVNDSYYRLPPTILKSINAFNPDLVWLYPHSLIKVAEQLRKYKILVTGPDCAALHTSRLIRDEFVFDMHIIDKTLEDYKERLNLEVKWQQMDNVYMHLVGHTDQIYFNTISPMTKARFFPHPHYKLTEKVIDLKKQTFKVLLSGKFDLYTYSDSIKLFRELVKVDNIIKEHFEFVFLGKGWDSFIDSLVQNGYKARKQGWVDDYVEFIKDFDIQIFPISVGSGTKGKVLDALSTGLLCIGSPYAFENIAVRDGESCLIYNNVRDVVKFCESIYLQSDNYNKIAKKGRENVRIYHDSAKITKEILGWCFSDKYDLDISPFLKLNLK